MNKVIKKKWVEALRSGEYKQGKGVLKSKDSEFCCMGVLADLLYEGEWEHVSRISAGWIRGQAGALNKETLSYCNMLTGEQNILAKMNDEGHSFNQIADWIEENL